MNEVNWKSVASQELWGRAVRDGNDSPSGYYMVDQDLPGRPGILKGTIHFALCIQSWIHPSMYHELTIKELMKAWDIWPLEDDNEVLHD